MMQELITPTARPWWNNITEVPDWVCRAQKLIEEIDVENGDDQTLATKVYYFDDLVLELVANFPKDLSKRVAPDHHQLNATFEFFRVIRELEGTFSSQCKRRRLSKVPPTPPPSPMEEEAPSGPARDATSEPAQSSSAPPAPPGDTHSSGDPDSPDVVAVPDFHDYFAGQDWDMGPETSQGDTLQ